MDSDTPTPSHQDHAPALHSPEEAESLAEYRSVSVASVIALVLGLLALLALVTPLLSVIAVVGILVAGWALASIARSEGRLIGRSLALIGLVLSVVSLAGGQARTAATTWLLSRQAQPTAEVWLGLLVAGEVDQAFHWTNASDQPPASPGPGAPPASPADVFAERPLVVQLQTMDDASDVRLVRTLETQRMTRGRFAVAQVYEVVPPDGGPSQLVRVTLQRDRASEATKPRWKVVDFSAHGE